MDDVRDTLRAIMRNDCTNASDRIRAAQLLIEVRRDLGPDEGAAGECNEASDGTVAMAPTIECAACEATLYQETGGVLDPVARWCERCGTSTLRRWCDRCVAIAMGEDETSDPVMAGNDLASFVARETEWLENYVRETGPNANPQRLAMGVVERMKRAMKRWRMCAGLAAVHQPDGQ